MWQSNDNKRSKQVDISCVKQSKSPSTLHTYWEEPNQRNTHYSTNCYDTSKYAVDVLSGGAVPKTYRRLPESRNHRHGPLYRVSKGPNLVRAEGSSIVDEPGGLRGNLISDHGLFSFYDSQQGATNGQGSRGVFQGCTGLRTVGYWLAHELLQLKASTDMDLDGTTIFLFSA